MSIKVSIISIVILLILGTTPNLAFTQKPWEVDMTFTLYESGDVHAKWIITDYGNSSYDKLGFYKSDIIINFFARGYYTKKKLAVSQSQEGEYKYFEIEYGAEKTNYKYIVEFDYKNAVSFSYNEYSFGWSYGSKHLPISQKIKIILPTDYYFLRLERTDVTPETYMSGNKVVVSFEGTTQKETYFRWTVYYKKKVSSTVPTSTTAPPQTPSLTTTPPITPSISEKISSSFSISIGILIAIIIIGVILIKGKSFFRDVSHKETEVEWEKKEIRKCINCGKTVPENSAFCGYCGKEQKIPLRILKDIPPNAIDLWTHENVLQMANKGSAIMRCPGCGAYYEKNSWDYFGGCAKPECREFAKK